jgi:hypothetical protein
LRYSSNEKIISSLNTSLNQKLGSDYFVKAVELTSDLSKKNKRLR